MWFYSIWFNINYEMGWDGYKKKLLKDNLNQCLIELSFKIRIDIICIKELSNFNYNQSKKKKKRTSTTKGF